MTELDQFTKNQIHSSFVTACQFQEIGVNDKSQLNSKKSKQKDSNSDDSKNEDNRRVIPFVEYIRGKSINHKIDFDSPRTAEAAAQLGITYGECLPKYFFIKCDTIGKNKNFLSQD